MDTIMEVDFNPFLQEVKRVIRQKVSIEIKELTEINKSLRSDICTLRFKLEEKENVLSVSDAAAFREYEISFNKQADICKKELVDLLAEYNTKIDKIPSFIKKIFNIHKVTLDYINDLQ